MGRAMGSVEARLASLGLVLPPPLQPPTGVLLPFPWRSKAKSKSLSCQCRRDDDVAEIWSAR